MQKQQYLEIANKYGHHSSWAVWAEEGATPKSGIGDLSVFDIELNPSILQELKPNIIMVGLNFSRSIVRKSFVNFHDSNPKGQDYKIRHAFKGTKYYGAYMTDIIKDFEEKDSGNVARYLKTHQEFERYSVELFRKEIQDIGSTNPILIAFGNDVFDILNKYCANEFTIIKIPHYSMYIGKEEYKKRVNQILGIL